MAHTGTIILIPPRRGKAERHEYTSKEHRGKLIQFWVDMYGHRFSYTIQPNVREVRDRYGQIKLTADF